MNNLKKNFLTKLLVMITMRKAVKKLTDKHLNATYIELLNIRKGSQKSSYPMWQIDIALKTCIKEKNKRDKSK